MSLIAPDETAVRDAPPPRLRTGVVLSAILAVAALVRVLGSRWGFPLTLHPDEWAVVDGVIDMARRNSFEPALFMRPDHLEMKVDFIAFAGFAHLFRGTSIEAAFAADPTTFYWIARLVTAAFGVASVALAFLIGRQWSRRTGLVAAALFAVFPLFVTNAHYATPDVPLTFTVLLLIYACMRYLETTSWASLLVACSAVSLAIAIKYPGALGCLMIALVVTVAARRDRTWRRLLGHGAASITAVLGFLFLISPVLFTNLSGVRAAIDEESRDSHFGAATLGTWGNLKFYVETYTQGAGIVLLTFGIIGAIVVVRRRDLRALPLVAGLVFWVALSALPLHWERWGLPMDVTPLLLAAIGIVTVWQWSATNRWRWAVLAASVLVAVQLCVGTAATLAALLAPDTRSSSLAFARENGITPQNSVFDGYSPFLPGHPAVLFQQFATVNGGPVPVTKGGDPATYVVLSSSMYNRFIKASGYPTEAARYRYLFDNLDQVASFEPVPAARPSILEPISIVRNLRAVFEYAGGGPTGPTIVVLEVEPAP